MCLVMILCLHNMLVFLTGEDGKVLSEEEHAVKSQEVVEEESTGHTSALVNRITRCNTCEECCQEQCEVAIGV